MKYHHLFYKDLIDVVVLEVKRKEYFWLTFLLNRKLRNGHIAKHTAKHVLFTLKGIHHIHFFPEIKALKKLSKELKWKREGVSRIFDKCVAYHSSSLNQMPSVTPLFNIIVHYHINKRPPRLRSFKDRSDIHVILEKIHENYF